MIINNAMERICRKREGKCDYMINIAVLMSTYNGSLFIKEQIESIIAQKGNFHITIIARDDGSEDGTETILQEYQDAGKIRWYSGINLGPARSFYSLIQENQGYDYYAFSDQDDVWDNDKLLMAIKSINQGCVDANIPTMYFANAELVDSKLNSLGKNVYNKFPVLNIESISARAGILGCTIVFNASLASIIQKSPGIPERMIMHDSYLAQVCVAYSGVIIADGESHMKYRQHGKNVVGVSMSWIDKVFDRIGYSFSKRPISIAEQSADILNRFGSGIPAYNAQVLDEISTYRESRVARIKLAFSRKVRYSSWSIGLRNRIAILLGNL